LSRKREFYRIVGYFKGTFKDLFFWHLKRSLKVPGFFGRLVKKPKIHGSSRQSEDEHPTHLGERLVGAGRMVVREGRVTRLMKFLPS
jgi:hypothetical protein